VRSCPRSFGTTGQKSEEDLANYSCVNIGGARGKTTFGEEDLANFSRVNIGGARGKAT
jgi:hypothetical protein